VAWALLRSASVLSLEDGILTLRFPREGEIKAFTVSGHDAVLKRVLSADFGLEVAVKGVTGPDSGARPARSSPGPGPAAPAPPRPRFDEPPADEIMPDEPDDMPPDEPYAGQAPRGGELTGMDLIQRELGGQVIGEIED
jgi:DNA polymerase-3 subunit gamma/tau